MNDLESAHYLMTSTIILYDNVVYHCQQAAEKSLKAFLLFNDCTIEKIHSLIQLTIRCEAIDSSFGALRPAVGYLNPYSTAFRYPADSLQPTKSETVEAIAYAESVVAFVKNLMDFQKP